MTEAMFSSMVAKAKEELRERHRQLIVQEQERQKHLVSFSVNLALQERTTLPSNVP